MKKIIYKKDIEKRVTTLLDMFDTVYYEEDDYVVTASRKDGEIEIIVKSFFDDIVLM